jgi:hypothetical protein
MAEKYEDYYFQPKVAYKSDHMSIQGILTERGMLSTIDLLNEVACFVQNVNDIFNMKRS